MTLFSSRTLTLHRGQHPCLSSNHGFMQSLWKACRHRGKRVNLSPTSKSSMQMEHSVHMVFGVTGDSFCERWKLDWVLSAVKTGKATWLCSLSARAALPDDSDLSLSPLSKSHESSDLLLASSRLPSGTTTASSSTGAVS